MYLGSTVIISLSFLFGLVLSQIPLPAYIAWLRPEFMTLLLVYWVMNLPHKVGIKTAFVLGLSLDVIRGGILGANALALVIVAYIASVRYRRLRMWSGLNQSLMVMVVVAAHQITLHLVQKAVGFPGDSWMFLLPALISGLIWALFVRLLDRIKRAYNVH